MVQVQDAQPQRPARRQFEQHVEQTHRIGASGYGHGNLLAALEHAITRDGFGNAFEHCSPDISL